MCFISIFIEIGIIFYVYYLTNVLTYVPIISIASIIVVRYTLLGNQLTLYIIVFKLKR